MNKPKKECRNRILVEAIKGAARKAFTDLFEKYSDEHFYYCTLVLMEGIFGSGGRRKSMVVLVEIMPPDYTNTERALRLNSREALKEWLEEAAEERRLYESISNM